MYRNLVKTSNVFLNEVMNYLETPTPNYRQMIISLGFTLPNNPEEDTTLLIDSLEY